MDAMNVMREFLVQNGADPEELDKTVEPPVIKDIGEGLTLSLMNDEFIGMDLFKLMLRVEELEKRVVELEKGGA